MLVLALKDNPTETYPFSLLTTVKDVVFFASYCLETKTKKLGVHITYQGERVSI